MMARLGTTLGLVLTGILVSLCFAAAASAVPHRIIWDPSAEASWLVEKDGLADGSGDIATDVAMAAGGVTYVCGGIQNEPGNADLSLTKIVNGVPKWTGAYDAYGAGERAERLAVGPRGVVYAVGTSMRGADYDLILVKWSPSGSILWKRRYDSHAALGDWGTGVVVDRSGNVTVCGYESTASTTNWLMRSYTAKGKLRWTWRFAPGGGDRAFPFDAHAAADGSVYVTGYVIKSGAGAAVTVRLSAAGRKLWMKTTRGPHGLSASTQAIVGCPSGGVYVCGAAQTPAGQDDGLVMRYAPNGTRKVFALDGAGGGAHAESFKDITVTSTRSIVAVGESNASGTSDCRVTTYRSDGTIVGGVTIPGADGHEQFTCVAADALGGFVAAGFWWSTPTNRQLCALRGSTRAGGGGWSAVFSGADSELAGANAVAARGNVVVVAGQYESTPTSGTDQIVLGFVY